MVQQGCGCPLFIVVTETIDVAGAFHIPIVFVFGEVSPRVARSVSRSIGLVFVVDFFFVLWFQLDILVEVSGCAVSLVWHIRKAN